MTHRTRVAVLVAGAFAVTAAIAIGLATISRALPIGHLLMIPILVAAYFGRLLPGLAATVAAAVVLLFVPEAGSPVPLLRPVLVLIVGSGTTIAIDALHRARISIDIEKRDAIDSKRRFSRLFHSSPMAMCVTRFDDGAIVETNSAYGNLFGISESQLIGSTAQAMGILFDPEARERVAVKMRERGWIHDEEMRVETRGGWRDISVSSQVIELDGVKHSIATFVDLTGRRAAERAASESQERFAELAANVEEVFWVFGAQSGKVEYMSPGYEGVFHRSASALEREPFDWINVVHHDDRARIMAAFTNLESRREATFRIVLPDGSMRTLKAAVIPIRGASGEIVRIAGITSDITAQTALEEQVRQAQKLESLGLLAGGVAHDFNNILAVIGSSAGMLEGVVPADDEELVTEISNAVKRGASLTRQLLAFSRRQVITPVVLDVNQVVEETRKMLRRMVGEDIKLSCSLDPELLPVMLDSGALVQVMMNLAVNARDAMPRGGSLSMTTRNSGNEVLLEVADSGCGMPPDIVARIFEPFFTTKGIGKGTGLGLSVVHGIVQQAGGRIEVRSQVGIGTTFSIYFPQCPAVAKATQGDVARDCRGDEKLLVVDDDIFVRAAAARALRTQGYTVLEATDGRSALDLIESHGESIALLVTDVVMPGMDGRELVEHARARRPSLKVLYTSGYTDDAVLLHGVQHDRVAFLEKPFRAQQLAGSVRRTLDLDVSAGTTKN